jgi:hypothetical protein
MTATGVSLTILIEINLQQKENNCFWFCLERSSTYSWFTYDVIVAMLDDISWGFLFSFFCYIIQDGRHGPLCIFILFCTEPRMFWLEKHATNLFKSFNLNSILPFCPISHQRCWIVISFPGSPGVHRQPKQLFNAAVRTCSLSILKMIAKQEV